MACHYERFHWLRNLKSQVKISGQRCKSLDPRDRDPFS